MSRLVWWGDKATTDIDTDIRANIKNPINAWVKGLRLKRFTELENFRKCSEIPFLTERFFDLNFFWQYIIWMWSLQKPYSAQITIRYSWFFDAIHPFLFIRTSTLFEKGTLRTKMFLTFLKGLFSFLYSTSSFPKVLIF